MLIHLMTPAAFPGDAITHDLLGMRRWLRRQGHVVRAYAQRRHPAFRHIFDRAKRARGALNHRWTPVNAKPATKGDYMRTSKVNAWYEWVPDQPDYRDKLYSAIAAPPKKLPPKVDLRVGCSRVENQGQRGSCTANALVGNMEFLQKKAGPQ